MTFRSDQIVKLIFLGHDTTTDIVNLQLGFLGDPERLTGERKMAYIHARDSIQGKLKRLERIKIIEVYKTGTNNRKYYRICKGVNLHIEATYPIFCYHCQLLQTGEGHYQCKLHKKLPVLDNTRICGCYEGKPKRGAPTETERIVGAPVIYPNIDITIQNAIDRMKEEEKLLQEQEAKA